MNGSGGGNRPFPSQTAAHFCAECTRPLKAAETTYQLQYTRPDSTARKSRARVSAALH